MSFRTLKRTLNPGLLKHPVGGGQNVDCLCNLTSGKHSLSQAGASKHGENKIDSSGKNGDIETNNFVSHAGN